MQRGSSGRYEITQTGAEPVRAFVPEPLPPVPPIDLVGPRARRHDEALLACGRLDAITALLPDPDLFLYAYVRREALLSSQIEGTQSSFSDLLLFELDEAPGVPFDDVVEVSSYVAALARATPASCRRRPTWCRTAWRRSNGSCTTTPSRTPPWSVPRSPMSSSRRSIRFSTATVGSVAC